MIVVVSTAHNTMHRGASRGDLYEHDWSLWASQACAEAIAEADGEAYTVSGGLAGSALWVKINDINHLDPQPDLALEMHFDIRGEERWGGPLVMCHEGSPVGTAVAKEVVAALVGLPVHKGRREKIVTLPDERYGKKGFVEDITCPSIIIEVGAASNNHDYDWLLTDASAIEAGTAVGEAVARVLLAVS